MNKIGCLLAICAALAVSSGASKAADISTESGLRALISEYAQRSAVQLAWTRTPADASRLHLLQELPVAGNGAQKLLVLWLAKPLLSSSFQEAGLNLDNDVLVALVEASEGQRARIVHVLSMKAMLPFYLEENGVGTALFAHIDRLQCADRDVYYLQVAITASGSAAYSYGSVFLLAVSSSTPQVNLLASWPRALELVRAGASGTHAYRSAISYAPRERGCVVSFRRPASPRLSVAEERSNIAISANASESLPPNFQLPGGARLLPLPPVPVPDRFSSSVVLFGAAARRPN